jgi:cytochrome b561
MTDSIAIPATGARTDRRRLAIVVVAVLAAPTGATWAYATGAFTGLPQFLVPLTFATPAIAFLVWTALTAITGSGLPPRPDAVAWHVVSKALHWSMALLILGTTALFYFMHFMDFTGDRPAVRAEFSRLLQIHKSLGLAVLALVAFRWAWNRRRPRPPEHAGSPAERRIARAAHRAIYGLMAAVPLAGWCSSMTYGASTRWFGLFEVPSWLPKDEALVKIFHPAHTYLAWALLALVALHVAAALWHHWGRRDATLVQMLPGRPSS